MIEVKDQISLADTLQEKIKTLHDKLGIETIEQLEAACKSGKIAELDGFGEKTATNILEGIQRRRTYASKHLLSDALAVADQRRTRTQRQGGRGRPPSDRAR